MLVEIPSEIFQGSKYEISDFMVDVAVMLYQMERVSLARAARMIGLNRLEFQSLLAERGVFLNYDLDGDLQALRKMGIAI